MSTLWHGRFESGPADELLAFTESLSFDQRLWPDDIEGSRAHVRGLARARLISDDERDSILTALDAVAAELADGTFEFVRTDEDIHTAVERRVTALAGPAGAKMHTGRSRNDQIATDVRLWCKRELREIGRRVIALQEVLVARADEVGHAYLPGYTHLQRAQPVLLAHHLLAYVSMFERDRERLADCATRNDVMPLGAGALAGVTYPIDREMTRAGLGFGAVTANSLDAVSDRDFVLDTLYAGAMIAMHFSRLAEELILWSTAEFRFLELADAFATGSSIMPQKKNPDVAELARGKTGRVYGNLVALLTVAKGTPLTYNKDFQEDKEALFDSVDTVLATLDVLPPMIRTARWRADRLAEAAIADFSLATDAADLLARRGVPFREAHEVTGKLVASCIAQGRTFADLTPDEWVAAHPLFASERPPLTAEESLASRDVPGGTAPRRVAEQLAAAQEALAHFRSQVSSLQDAWTTMMREGDRLQ